MHGPVHQAILQQSQTLDRQSPLMAAAADLRDPCQLFSFINTHAVTLCVYSSQPSRTQDISLDCLAGSYTLTRQFSSAHSSSKPTGIDNLTQSHFLDCSSLHTYRRLPFGRSANSTTLLLSRYTGKMV
jgi:hypothetical protein